MPDQVLVLEWETVKDTVSPDRVKYLQEIAQSAEAPGNDWLYDLGFKQFSWDFSAALDYFLRFSRCFIRALLKTTELETLRQDAVIDLPAGLVSDFISACPMMAGAEYVTAGMLEGLWQEFNGAFARDIEAFKGGVSDYFREKKPDLHPAGRVFFHLVENKNSDLPFAFMTTYSAGMGANGKPKHLPLKHAIETHDDDELLTLLSTVYKAAEKSRIVTDLIESGEFFHPLAWDGDEAFCFLKEIPDYEACGVLCRIPDWWKQSAATPRVTISLGDNKPIMAGLNALPDFNASVELGGLALSRQEVETILEQSQDLAFIKNKEVKLTKAQLNRLDLVITSYTLVKKYAWLAKYSWHCLILDEAQAIKNPATQQTRAVKTLPAAHRIVMTGTPVENRLSDLWSLFDFLNPGLLDNKTEFSGFAKTLFKRRTKRHTTAAEVIEKSDMAPQKVRNILSGLIIKGKLERVSRGVYKWVRPEPR